MSQALAGRVAVVTGAAAGIGAALTRRFLREGAEVIAADINEAALDELAETPDGRERLFPIRVDIASASDVQALRDLAQSRGKLDILVNNAGIFPSKSFAEMSFEDWRAMMAVNLDGVFLVTKALTALLIASPHGRIINISSSSVFAGTPNAAHYVAAKAGVIGFSRVLASELGRFGVTVNVVTPGLTLTETMRQKAPQQLIEARRQQRAIPRDQLADDVIGAVAFLAGDDAAFITGQILNVDGGIVKH